MIGSIQKEEMVDLEQPKTRQKLGNALVAAANTE
jgi:hypothetical protein